VPPSKPATADSESEALAEKVLAGDRRALARAITLIESTRPDHRAAAEALLARLLPASGRSVRLGISGVPGVGNGGSILGDKTRMEELARAEAAFIRPSPTGGTLGGVARRTREAMLACEAAGFDVIVVETVGVGQSETAVAEMVDIFLLLLLPGGGDELQGVKRGIMELADLALVTKADGELEAAAGRAAAEYQKALTLLRPTSPNWRVPVLTCSAAKGTGIAEVWDTVGRFQAALGESGELAAKRARQAKAWMWNEVSESLLAALRADPEVAARLAALEAEVMAGKISPTVGAQQLLERFLVPGQAPGPKRAPERGREPGPKRGPKREKTGRGIASG
jgi:LAO/AO transport system kinase